MPRSYRLFGYIFTNTDKSLFTRSLEADLMFGNVFISSPFGNISKSSSWSGRGSAVKKGLLWQQRDRLFSRWFSQPRLNTFHNSDWILCYSCNSDGILLMMAKCIKLCAIFTICLTKEDIWCLMIDWFKRMMSQTVYRWKERFFVLTSDYFHCFRWENCKWVEIEKSKKYILFVVRLQTKYNLFDWILIFIERKVGLN